MASSPSAILGDVLTPAGLLEDAALVHRGETIEWVGTRADAAGSPWADVVAAAAPAESGVLVLPGLVEVHNHGGGGASFPDAEDAETALIAAREHLRHGTTSLTASLVTADPDTLAARTAVLAELCDAGELAAIHLEGPFLAKSRCGAQNPDFMQAPSPALVARIAEIARGHFATMTIAPEIPGNVGGDSVVAALAAAGAVPSFGHTDCSAQQMTDGVTEAVAALAAPGARSPLPTATHLFNGMRPIHHRDPGPALASLAAAARGEMIVELVADGTHLAGETTKAVYDLVGADAIALVTDAMAAAGMPDGEYVLGPVRVRVAGGVARLADGDSIAGGTAHLLDVVRSTVAAGVPLADAVRSASLVPARVLGMADVIGSLEAGKRADFLLVTPELAVRRVVRRGVTVA